MEIAARQLIQIKIPFVLALLVSFLMAAPVLSEEPFRTIAILENERMLEAEPNIRLADYLRSTSDPIRIRAILAAARIGNDSILPDLKTTAQDKNPEARKHLAFALGQIRSKKGLGIAASLLKDPDLEVRRLAIEAIGRIGGMETTRLLVPLLRDKTVSLREQSALALALIKDKGTVHTLVNLTADKDPAQWSYVYALYRLADERSLPALHEVLANPIASPSTDDPSSLLFALKALWTMKKPLTAEETRSLLQHSDPRVQQNALDVISASMDKSACTAIHGSYAQMATLTKLKALETMAALPCEVVERPENAALLGAWILANARMEKEKSLSLLQEGVKHENWTVRWRTAQAFSELPAESAIPPLKVLMRDPDSAVRLASLESLTKYLPATADLFLPLLKHSDFAVRATAADALGKTNDIRHVPALIKSYESSHDPDEIEGRVAILDALSAFNSSDVLSLYDRALLDPDYTIRRHAIDGIKKLVGSSYYRNDTVIDPEDFLYLKGKVTQARQNEYPAHFGQTLEDMEVTMKLTKGEVVIRLLGREAPLHVENFKKLMQRKFYNGLRIHRVVPNFVIQGGDPRGDGWGGAGEVLPDQFNLRGYTRGMVGMPTAGKDTGGSQFFITHSRQPHLDGNYTIFGEVISGMDVVDLTEVGDVIISVMPRTR